MKGNIFMLVVLLLGLILYMLSTKIENSKCVDDAVRSANKGLVVISVLFVALPIAFMGCKVRCEKMRPISGKLSQCCMYAIFFLLLGIVLISLGSVIMGRAKKCPSDQDSSLKSSSLNVIIIGVAIFVASAGFLGWSYSKKSGAVTTSAFDFPSYFE